MNKPKNKPTLPYFNSGPTCKHPGWNLQKLSNALVGRGHRSIAGQEKLKEVIALTKEILKVPDDYRVGIMPGSATGATESALWSFLGARGVDVFSWDLFGSLWSADITNQLKISDTRVYNAPYGHLPDLSLHTPDRDVVFTWNGTTTGVCVPNLDWISDKREGLSICDATSAAFCVPLDWQKLDVVSFSWQKGLGGEGAHGMLILGPRAIDRLATYTPPWPIPRLFRLTKDSAVLEEIFQGGMINTPSMLSVEDCLGALQWAKSIGGLSALIQRCQNNSRSIDSWVKQTPWIAYLAKEPQSLSPTSICLEFLDTSTGQPLPEAPHRALIHSIETQLAKEGVAYDIRNHKHSLPSLRIWAGPTVETSNLEALFPWIEWAYTEASQTA
ncbi:MAG: phosphoserine transaminase [Alphaproteobacteria bacterium]|nr:phosphoserine transaminase [Alphaproteobacteria bacterium]